MSMKNQIKTAILLAVLTAMLLFIGSLFGKTGFYFALIFVALMNFVSYWFSHKIVLWMYRAKEAKKFEYPKLYKIVGEVARLNNMPMPKVYIIPTETPNCFATGRNENNAVVAATEGILKILNEDELKAVIAHEFGHIKNRDILISTIAGTIAGVISYIGAMARWSAIFGGRDDDRGNNLVSLLIIGILTPLIAMLIQLAISRSREYLADALEKIEKNVNVNPLRFGTTATAHLFIVNPFRNATFLSMFMTHPPTAERTKRLRAMKF